MIASGDTVLRWSEHRLVPDAGASAGVLLVADSWLVADGAVRGLDAHWARFGGWCAELGIAAGEIVAFREAAIAALPRGRGRWFPRVEAVAVSNPRAPAPSRARAPAAAPVPPSAAATYDAAPAPPAPAATHLAAGSHSDPLDLRLRLRPAAAPAGEARVILGAPGDPRTRPAWKGPDLGRLVELRAHAVASGADELLLRDEQGLLIEGALSSLLWWEGGTLCTTPAERTLPGITRALLLDLARRRGVAVCERSPQPEELTRCEAWLTSALHGIRVVAGYGPAPRAASWQSALADMARPLPPPR